MVKKRIYILTLSFIFLVSTTGMPLIIHYCKMMETASLQACEMHSKEIKQSSCCNEDNNNGPSVKKVIDECCKDFVVDHSVKETFITSKTEINIPIYLYTHLPVEFNLTSNYQTNQEIDTSPPPLLSNKIYLANSILLI